MSPLFGLFVLTALLSAGVIYSGRKARPDGEFALHEVILVLSGVGALALEVGVLIGAASAWPPRALAGMHLAGLSEVILGSGLAVWLATRTARNERLFQVGLALVTPLGVAHLILLTLSAF